VPSREGVEIALFDPDDAVEAVGGEIAVFDPTSNGASRNVCCFGDRLDGVKAAQAPATTSPMLHSDGRTRRLSSILAGFLSRGHESLH
jgi:hypothetical protein